MWWPIGPYGTIMAFILASTIPLRNLLTRDEPEERLRLSELPQEIRSKGYKWRISLYLAMYLYKAVIDHHNEPLKGRVGGYTHWVHQLEGDFTLWAQDAFRGDLLTEVLAFHYLFVYLFIIWFVPIYFILVKDHVMADKAALNYLVVYVLAVPLYLFFNVEVTSSFIPGMDALLYHDSWYIEFITNNDPLDNGVPSLHFGLPLGLLIINRLHCRELGLSLKEWRHRELDIFIMVNLGIYLFSIQYLGIHWISDTIPGIILAIICAYFCHNWQPSLRDRPSNGWRSIMPSRRGVALAVAISVACTSAIALVAIDGPGSDDDIANFRLGPGDVVIDTIEVHSLNHPVAVEIRNVGEFGASCVILERSHVVSNFDKGEFSNGFVFEDLLDYPYHQVIPLIPGESWKGDVETPSIFDTNLVLCHSPGGISELRISMEYVDDELIFTGILASLPAFIITGLVVDVTSRSEGIEGEDAPDVDS